MAPAMSPPAVAGAVQRRVSAVPVGADDFRDNSPTSLLLFACSPSDTSQLWNLG